MPTFAEIERQIKPGHVLALHDKFVPSWYGLKIQAVQLATGKYCHVGLLDIIDGEVWLYESVIPLVRACPLRNILGDGFFWLPLSVPMSDAERQFARSKIGVGGYSQFEAVRAGVGSVTDTLLPDDNQKDDLWECARYVREAKLKSNVFLGDFAVPTKIVEALQIGYRTPVIEVTK